MVKHAIAALLVLLALAGGMGQASAAQSHGFDVAKKSGFEVIGLLTADPDWQRKWNTSPQTTPKFEGIDVQRPGVPIYVLTFFSGAEPVGGRVKLSCEVTVVEPTGKKTHLPAQTCLDTPIPHPEYINLTGLDFKLEADPQDPSGMLDIRIVITDLNRGLSLPLHLSIKVDTSGGKA